MAELEVPLYMKIANSLKNDIVSELYAQGDLLPTEEDLENQFNDDWRDLFASAAASEHDQAKTDSRSVEPMYLPIGM